MPVSAQSRRVLFVHAHPDDEALYTGASIAQCIADGFQVMVVTCTRGEEGDILDPSLSQSASAKNDNLGQYRSEELAAALQVFGVRRHLFLGAPTRKFRDSGMTGRISNQHPHAFTKADVMERANLLAQVILDFDPQIVITYDPSGGYGHPDHIQTNLITTKALAIVAESTQLGKSGDQAPILMWCMIPDSQALESLNLTANLTSVKELLDGALESALEVMEQTVAVPVAEFISEKVAALRCHKSQMGPKLFEGLSDQEILSLIPTIELLIPSQKL